MIGTAAAIIGSAIVGAGATALASSNAASAAKKQAEAVQQGTDKSIAEQQREFDAIQANNAPFRNAGVSALGALGSSFGLAGYGPAPSMTGRVASTPVPGVSGVSMTGSAGLGDQARGGANLGTVKSDPGLGAPTGDASMTGGTAAAGAGAPMSDAQKAQWDAYIAANPDVATWISQGHGDPAHPGESPEEAAAFHYQNGGQAEGRVLPPISMTDPAATGAGGYVAPPGYSDPTAPQGYGVGARPDPGAAPTRPDIGPLNVGLDAYQRSPDFNFRLQQGNAALDHVASSMGGIMSGARLKAADRYNQDYATTDYNNWRDYTTNQYNTNRNVSNSNYGVDLSQFDNTRARSDGLYADDRAFSTGRYDTRNAQLMSLAGFGQNSTNATNQAGQSFAQNQTQLNMTAANAQGNAAINSANAFTSGVNNLITTGAYLGGKLMTSNYGVSPGMTAGGYGGYGSAYGAAGSPTLDGGF